MRYTNDRTIKNGTTRVSNRAAIRLRRAFDLGNINAVQVTIGESMRLDHVAFRYLGSASLWWAIAALSDIGWGMQLPAGTRLLVPTSREQIEALF